MNLGRRALLVGALTSIAARVARADTGMVPARMQAELLAKLAPYDRNFAPRAGDVAKVVLVTKEDDVESTAFAAELKGTLPAFSTFGTVPHEELVVSMTDAQTLAAFCRSHQAAILYLCPGLSKQIESIRNALGTLDVLTVGAVAEYVPAGIVLGFDLLFGKPKLLVNLTQAQKQHVDFRADLLKMVKIYE
jgi:hypothetical protein